MDFESITVFDLRSAASWAAPLIFAVTIIGVAVGRFPYLRMNRATIALVGATALVLFGGISLDSAFDLLDWNTLSLLLAMMILNANLRISGFFQWISFRLLHSTHSPVFFLGLTIAFSGILSSLLLNDTIVLMFTPIILEIARTQRRNPVPFLMALALSANIGSAATLIGNPQNMLIGIASGISFIHFAAVLAPLSLLCLGIVMLLVWLVYRRDFQGEFKLPDRAAPPRTYHPLLIKSLLACGLMLAGLIAGLPLPLAALSGAGMLLVTRRLKPERVFREVDWSLLVLFAGLFVVTGAIEEIQLGEVLLSAAEPLMQGGVSALTLTSAALSNLVSNVPAVLLLKPIVARSLDPTLSWLTLAMATTFAGNLTLFGSVANLIVAELARREGVKLTFGEYLKSGIPVTALSLAIGILWFGRY
ncbi:MAG: anion transporter [Acidobacteriota bacterium]|nr:MAG: anion transporter [Acidobacteriota bacterium]